MLFSASTGGFYDPAIHTSLPPDAAEISDGLYAALLAGQEAGGRIVAGAGGLPVIIPRAQPTPEALLAAERATMVASRFQARAALHHAGLLAAIEAAVQGANPIVRIAWADAQEWRRDSPTLTALAAQIGLPEGQIDDLFRAAMQIRA